MRRAVGDPGAALLLLFLPGGCVHDSVVRGPMPVRNQHPAQLTVLHMDPASAEVLPAGRFHARAGASYSSLFLTGEGAGNRFSMDGEILHARWTGTAGLGDGLQLTAEIAGAHTSGGFLDEFVQDWHDFFGLPDQNRDEVQNDLFDVSAELQGQLAWQQREETARLMDLPLTLTWGAVPPREGAIGLALRGAVELPTGDDKRGFGNGEVDWALGAVGEWRLPGLSVTGHLQHTWAGTPDQARAAGLEFRNVTSFGLGVEWPVTGGLTALVQTEVETSTLRGLHFDRVSRNQWLLWVGGRGRLATHWFLEVAVGEDLRGFVSPDFSAWLSVAWLPGSGG